ncbi:MAG: araG [Phycisphaerales bacterium]|nr:araG [Phycisphaerales bacterium]
MAADGFLRFQNVAKSFPGVRALDGVSFQADSGSVHALMGENGAGKSTLLKTLSGVYRPDAGRLVIGGVPQTFRSTADAIRAGVAVIYQELHLVADLSVEENLYLGHLPNAKGWVNRRVLRENALRQLASLGEDISPSTRVGRLSIGQRQMVEIAKALTRDAKIIAFDEPTSSLSAQETDRLFRVIRSLRDSGRVILYVSHRMDEIYALCDATTVLRDGRHVETFPSLKALPRDTLVQRMVGRSITDIFSYAPRPHGKVALEVDGIAGPGLAAPVSFSVAKGEILGFFGLIGAGRSELLKLIYGAARRTAGTVRLEGRMLDALKPSSSIRLGTVLAPEDRKKEGIVPMRSIAENLNISARRHFSRFGFLINPAMERQNAEQYVSRLAIKTPSVRQLIRNLSGGNQQKVILARWLSEKPKVVLLDEPTRGIDIGAKSEIYSIIYQLAREGVAVVVVSSELPEIMGISDRIMVMRSGKVSGVVPRDQFSAERLLNLALPITDHEDTRVAV